MKRGLNLLILLALVIVFLVLVKNVNASFELGANSSQIEKNYYPSENIKGWINISLNNEPINSVLKGFDDEINLLDFLSNASASYSCFPANCGIDYVALSGTGIEAKSFSLTPTQEKLLGFQIQGEKIDITGFSFNVKSTATPSCASQLNIDLLDDGGYNWKAHSVLEDSFCSISGAMSCFDDNYAEVALITYNTPYCQKINFPAKPKFKISAGIYNATSLNEAVEFKLQAYVNGMVNDFCTVNSEAGVGFQEIGCVVELDLEQNEDAYVCISTNDDYGADDNKYYTLFESNEPCGFSGYPETFDGEFEYDFYIFADYSKYDAVKNFTFNDNELRKVDETSEEIISYVKRYISANYNNNCSKNCVIPIKFYSLNNQQVDISNINIKYSSGGISKPAVNQIYEIQKTPSKINMGFQKLDLEKANLHVPFEKGTHDLDLKLNNLTILNEEIEVGEKISIKKLLPSEAGASVLTRFSLLLDKKISNTSYVWDFGDNTTETSNEPEVYHKYDKVRIYELKVSMRNYLGEFTQSFSVKVIAPKDSINNTLLEYKGKLDSLETEINKLSKFIADELKKSMDITGLKEEVNKQRGKYNDCFGVSLCSDEDYVKIMSDLLKLDIPNFLNISLKITPSKTFLDSNQLNMGALESLIGNDIQYSEKDYYESVLQWSEKNLDITFESQTYSLYYDDRVEDAFSHIDVTLSPKDDLKDVYFLVNGNPENIRFNTDYEIKEYTDAVGIIFSELTGSKTIEFLYPEKIQIKSVPIFVSTKTENLEFRLEVGICNFNKRCEKSLKEDYKNCRSDCKPVGWIVFFISLTLFAGFVVYIILQEWYKKHYESRLFPDKNQLFNLINFMNNAINQGVRKSEIFNKLKEQGWNSEQLRFCWNKLYGKRTGMWEIPIFKWVENRKVKEELKKRGSEPVY